MLVEDGFENGLSAWSPVRGVLTQSADVEAGYWAAEATSTGLPAFARRTLGSASTDVDYALEFKIVSQGAHNVTLMALRPTTGPSLASVFVNARSKLALRVGTTAIVSPTVVSKNIWHSLRLQVHVAGSDSRTDVWLDGTSIP
ncbi:MAG: hypothetical protein H0U77_07460, partial [Nocardioidaceae bacterium]|nr:hypothetical protein [Nocardioidaceae bacterium]